MCFDRLMERTQTFTLLGREARGIVKKLKRYRTKKARPPKAREDVSNRRAHTGGEVRQHLDVDEKARSPPSRYRLAWFEGGR